MYLTRNMRARIPMTYMGRALVAGDEFQATELDAAYLAKHKRAEDASSAPEATIVPEVGFHEVIVSDADAEFVEQVKFETAIEVQVPRRRGRPRKNG